MQETALTHISGALRLSSPNADSNINPNPCRSPITPFKKQSLSIPQYSKPPIIPAEAAAGSNAPATQRAQLPANFSPFRFFKRQARIPSVIGSSASSRPNTLNADAAAAKSPLRT